MTGTDYRDLTAKHLTHVNRSLFLIKRFLENGERMNELLFLITRYSTPDTRVYFETIFKDYKQNLEDLAETMELIGEDVTEIGEEFISFIEGVRKESNE